MGVADTEDWDQVVQKSYGLQPEFFESGKLAIKFYVGRSFFFGSYLATAPYLTDGGYNLNGSPLSEAIVDDVQTLRYEKKFDYALIRTRRNIYESMRPDVQVDLSQFSFLMDISAGSDQIWEQSLDPKIRNQTRKGLKSGIVRKIGGIELVNDFYRVISEVWRDLGTPTHAQRYFEIILETFGEQSNLVVLYLGGQPVSAALVLIQGNTLYHPYAGTLKKFNPFSVNNVLYWTIIEYGCRQGCDAFDMGRSPKNSGTFRYKESWGATPVPLFYTYFLSDGGDKPDNATLLNRSMVKIWRFCPLRVANTIGPGLIKGVL